MKKIEEAQEYAGEERRAKFKGLASSCLRERKTESPSGRAEKNNSAKECE